MTDLDDEVGSPAEEFKAFAADTGMNRSQSEYCNVGTKTYLTNHPAKKFVFDFMRVLIIDNLCLTPASKQTPLIDLLLEVRARLEVGRQRLPACPCNEIVHRRLCSAQNTFRLPVLPGDVQAGHARAHGF